MLNDYMKNCFAKFVFGFSILFANGAWSQTAKVTSIPVPMGDIATNTSYNTIYGFKVEVGDYDITLENLTVNFTGSFPSHIAKINTIAYDNIGTPFNPNHQNIDNSNYYGSLSATGSINRSWNYNMSAGNTYYFYIEADFYDQGTVSGLGSTITASLSSLDALQFSAANPVTVTGIVGAGTSYSVVNSSYKVTPLSIPGRNIQNGSTNIPIAGYRIEAAPNILTSVVQSEIVASITGTYIGSVDGIDLRYVYLDFEDFNYDYSSSYTDSYHLTSNSSSETVDLSVYTRYIYKGRPKYVFLIIENASVRAGKTISAKIDPALFANSATGAVISGSVFTFTSPIPIVTVPSAFNTNQYIGGVFQSYSVYTFGITAPPNDNFVFAGLNISLSGVTNSITDFSSSASLSLFPGQVKPTPETIGSLNNFQSISNNYLGDYTDTVTALDINIDSPELIPAGQTKYYTIGVVSYSVVSDKKIQVLGINTINQTTFAGVSMAGGIKTTKSIASFYSINTFSGSNISPYGEQLIYEFVGENKTKAISYIDITQLVVTLTGNLDISNIDHVSLKYNNAYIFDGKYSNASTMADVYNPASNVITFTGSGGAMYNYDLIGNKFFITITLQDPLAATVIGANVGIAAIDEQSIVVDNPSLPGTTALGSHFQPGKLFTYTYPGVVFTANTIAGIKQIVTNQSTMPIYSSKVVANNSVRVDAINFTTSGTYTSNDLNGFYLYACPTPVFEALNTNVSYVTSYSTGSGEALSFINNFISKDTSYLFIVPDVANTTSIGSTVKIEAIPSGALLFPSTLIGFSADLPAGNIYTIIPPSITFTGVLQGGGTIGKGGNVKSYTVEVNSTTPFTLQNLVFKTNGNYDTQGMGGVTVYLSSQILTSYFVSNIISYNQQQSSLTVRTNAGETMSMNDWNASIPAGKHYITFFMAAGTIDNESFGIAGIETSLTTLSGGAAITYVNNLPGIPTTVVSELVTLTSLPTGKDTVYRADNQLLYAVKYVANTFDYLYYVSFYTLGTADATDLKSDVANSYNVWMDTSSTFSTATATKISDPANGAVYKYGYYNHYRFYNYSMALNANTPYYFYVTVDVSPSAAIGRNFKVYGESPGIFESNFIIQPSAYNYYSIDWVSSFMDFGRAKIIVGETNPLITFSGVTLTVGGAALDISTLFATNSTGMVSYSIAGTAASLSGATLTAVSGGTVTVTSSVNAAPGFNAGSQSAVFTITVPTGTVEELLSASVALYPNPSSGIVYVNGDFDMVTIADIIGSTLFTSSRSTLDLSSLAEGLYFVKITKGSSSVVKKIVIKK